MAKLAHPPNSPGFRENENGFSQRIEDDVPARNKTNKTCQVLSPRLGNSDTILKCLSPANSSVLQVEVQAKRPLAKGNFFWGWDV